MQFYDQKHNEQFNFLLWQTSIVVVKFQLLNNYCTMTTSYMLMTV